MLLASRAAAAQERIAGELPDLDLREVSLRQGDDGGGTTVNTLWQVSGSMGQVAGPGGPGVDSSQDAGSMPSLSTARLRMGSRARSPSSFQARSELRVDPLDHASPTSVVTGRHDLRARVVTRPDRHEMGGDLIFRSSVRHLGERRLALAPVDVGPAGHLDSAASLTLAVLLPSEKNGGKQSGFRVPVTAGVRRIDYTGDATPVRRAVETRVAASIDGYVFARGEADVAIEIVGASYSALALDSGEGADPAAMSASTLLAQTLSPDAIGTATVRLGGIDGTLADGNKLRAALSGYTGWTWLRNPQSGLASNLFTARYGFELVGEDDGDEIGMGLVLAREGRISADGKRLLAEVRVESRARYTTDAYGASLHGAASWVTSEDSAAEGDMTRDPGILGRYAVHAEAFHALTPGVHFGIYQLATYEPRQAGQAGQASAWDVFQPPRFWQLEIGGFVRWSGKR